MLQTSTPICKLHLEATCPSKMRSYFQNLQITNQVSGSMRNLHSDAKYPSSIFTSYQKLGTIFARQALSKKYIRCKQVNNRRLTVSRLPLSLSDSLLTSYLTHIRRTISGLQ